jgi:hypothetical protein
VSLSPRRQRRWARCLVHVDHWASGRRPVTVAHRSGRPCAAARAGRTGPDLHRHDRRRGAARSARGAAGPATGPRPRPRGASRARLILGPAGHGPEVILPHPGEPDETRIHRDFIYRSVAGP